MVSRRSTIDVRKVYHGVGKVHHSARKVYHGVSKVYHGVRKVYHGERKVYHGVRKIYHGVLCSCQLAFVSYHHLISKKKNKNMPKGCRMVMADPLDLGHGKNLNLCNLLVHLQGSRKMGTVGTCSQPIRYFGIHFWLVS
jgi:hypothetical protein